jgi:excisionase family DNA binding protein
MTTSEHGQDGLITVEALAKILSVNTFTVYRWKDAGKIPAAVKIGGAVRWRLGEIQDWIRCDCPPRSRWEAMREGA